MQASIKKTIRILGTAVVAVAAMGCRHNVLTDSDAAGLHGSVRRVECALFEALEIGGVPQKADEEPYAKSVCEFDRGGHLTAVESFAAGMLCNWGQRLYDDAGRLNKIMMQSVRNGGDRVVEIDYPDRSSQHWRVLDEEGRVVAERTMPLAGYSGIVFGQTEEEPAFFESRLRGGRIAERSEFRAERTDRVSYEYGDSGEVTLTLADGERLLRVESDCDAEGNWRQCTLYSVDSDGIRTLRSIEERTIVYY